MLCPFIHLNIVRCKFIRPVFLGCQPKEVNILKASDDFLYVYVYSHLINNDWFLNIFIAVQEMCVV